MLRVSLTLLLLVASGACNSPRNATTDAPAEPEAFSFTYSLHLGRDCFMMGDCGFRLDLLADGTLRRVELLDEAESASVLLSPEEREALLMLLEREGFFGMPEQLPRLAEGEWMPQGGRVVSMAFESADGARSHRVDAYTDLDVAPPEAFHELEAAVRAYLTGLLEGE